MRILVPVDGTPESEAAIPVAKRLAEALDAEICLLHVVEVLDAFSPLRFDPDILQMMENRAIYLGELMSPYELPANRTVCRVEHSDDAAKEIVAVAKKEGIDLIVMATRRKRWLQRMAQGSVYREVLGAEACPVLGIPPGAHLAAVDTGRRTVPSKSPRKVEAERSARR